MVLLVLAWLDPFLTTLCILSLLRETALSLFKKTSFLMESTLPSASLWVDNVLLDPCPFNNFAG